jgi:hypothetical protein
VTTTQVRKKTRSTPATALFPVNATVPTPNRTHHPSGQSLLRMHRRAFGRTARPNPGATPDLRKAGWTMPRRHHVALQATSGPGSRTRARRAASLTRISFVEPRPYSSSPSLVRSSRSNTQMRVRPGLPTVSKGPTLSRGSQECKRVRTATPKKVGRVYERNEQAQRRTPCPVRTDKSWFPLLVP